MRTFWMGLLVVTAISVAGCGEGGEDAMGAMQIFSITSPVDACVATPMILEGLNFLSEHGIEVTIVFEAATGTPFEGGTSATAEVTGTVMSNTLIELLSPVALADVTATVTVTLPGGHSATSAAGLAELAGGSLGPPQANPDAYPVIGNVLIDIPANQGVLLNDELGGCVQEEEEPQEEVKPGSASTASSHLSVTNFDAVSVQGGTIVMNPDGSFTYNPPVGYEGPDSFDYEMTDGDENDSTTVTLNIQEMVWFIDDTATEPPDGRFTNPFPDLFGFNGVQGGGAGAPKEGDWIFVYYGTGEPYDGGIELLDLQKLIGEGVDLMVLGQLIVPAFMRPTLTNTGVDLGDVESVPCIVLGNANRIDGLDVLNPTGEGILGTDVDGPTTVDNCSITGAGMDGILLEGDCSGSFDFGTTVSVTDAQEVAVRINGFGDEEPELTALTFAGQFTYEGTISQTDTGPAISVFDTSAGSTVTFQNGTIDYDGDDFAAIDMSEVQGTLTCTSPQSLLGMPFIGIFIDISAGTFTFADTTMDLFDDGFSSSGVEVLEVQGGTFTFTDLDVTIDGDDERDSGGVGIRAGNLNGGDTTNLTVDGVSQVTMTDAEDAVLILGDPLAPINLDVTLQSVSVDGSPQTGGLFFSDCTGTFTVTGTTTITNFSSAGILVLGIDTDYSFATLNISNGTGSFGRGMDLNDNAGSFTVSAGLVDNMTLDGFIIEDSNVTMSNIAFSNIGADVLEFTGTCSAGGTGNTATGFGNLCNSGGATVTGSVSFTTPNATCP